MESYSKFIFAAFIITFRRSALLNDTINKLLLQSQPPDKILIIDNDPEKSAEYLLHKFPGKKISYFSVGYNSGPAGAAYYGLKILAEEGWEWIAWVDDDNPPVLPNQLERIMNIIKKFLIKKILE